MNLFATTSVALLLGTLSVGCACAQEIGTGKPDENEIVVTASTLDLQGKAQTASQGSITPQEVQQRPVYRIGQLLETVPGLTVTAHSGEGKANQYLLRGFNLDHGTDLATFVDGMPVNQRTHAHGQGYTDLNFLLPELIGGIDFSKGPYFASEGDFSSVGADHMRLVDRLPLTLSLSAGTVGDRRAFAGGSTELQDGSRLLLAGEIFHLDGPWDHPDNFRRYNGAVRWSKGTEENGFAVTVMGYSGDWNATTDQPLRAWEAGIISRFGSLDPSDGGTSSRYSLSLTAAAPMGSWTTRTSVYLVRQRMTLWNNFTHLLEDPVNGDQHGQNDRRWTMGGSLEASRNFSLAGVENDFMIGVQRRYDSVRLDLSRTRQRQLIEVQRDDRVNETSAGVYLSDDIRWSPWLRTVFGVRWDDFRVSNQNFVGGLSGRENASRLQPKGSVILGPWAKTEIYFSAGRGFHSNDGRAGLVDSADGNTRYERAPLLVSSTGVETGARTSIVPGLTAAVSAFQIDFDSELTYDADAGQTEAGRPSRRRGIEFTGQYRPVKWLEVNANIAFSHARYRDGHPGVRYIEDAPAFVGSAGVLIDNLGPWFGSVVWRKLGSHPLLEDNSVRSHGYSEVNLNIGYKLSRRLRLGVEVFNVGNSHDDAADYYYATRLDGEPAGGLDGIQAHPLEPRSAKATLSFAF